MARIITSDGNEVSDFDVIQARLANIGITLRHWPAPTDAASQALLGKPVLDADEKEALLRAVDHRFEALKQAHGYASRDMVVLQTDTPGLAEVLAKFEKIHYHSDDEVRYILAGKGYFGFVDKDGSQFKLEVNADDYINVPARTEHWFVMGDSTHIKAVRYFIDTSGWTPVYTQRALLFG